MELKASAPASIMKDQTITNLKQNKKNLANYGP